MIEIDGSMHSGSGTVLRCAVALAALQGVPRASVTSTFIPVPNDRTSLSGNNVK